MSALIEAHALTLARGERCLVRDLDFRMDAGECWAVLGPNGSGKTTLLKALAGLVPVPPGHLELGGQALERIGVRERARSIGLVLQQGHPGLHNTALELVMSGHHPHRRHWWDTPEEYQDAHRALREVGLDTLAQQDTQTLSGGELRRAEIARLLVQSPAIALLDEPFNHLDIGQQVSMIRLLRRHFVRRDKGLLLVSHDLNLATQVASHCLLLHGDGRWSAGPTSEVAAGAAFGELFQFPLVEYRGAKGPYWGIDWEG